MSGPAFARYAPFIQEFIYRKQWTDLREVQVEACQAILDTQDHVIVASGTASGKTEAAFFPILTALEAQPSASIGVLYIGPLKALINDQFERLSLLLDESGIPVWPWHGDVSQSVKKRALKEAQGVLQITPESLEALLMRHPGEAQRLFFDLRFVIIDEIHAFMGTDRGLQLQCLLARMEALTGCSPRRVGLSATLNEYGPAMRFLAAGTKRGACAVGITKHQRKISLCVESFVLPEEPEEAEEVYKEYNQFLYDSCHDKKCLIFTNSRGGAEEVTAELKEIAGRRREPDIFYVHHGSVSASLRQQAETALRETSGPTVAAATLTLELGIDLGDLDTTIQLGAPFSCASFVQRLGRSGRRSGKAQMLFVNLYDPKAKNPFEQLPWALLRAIAVIQLYLEERFVEPFFTKPKPFSLLVQQTLSVLHTYGELSPAELAGHVLPLPPFRDTVTAEEYRLLLRSLLEQDYLQRMETGTLILGLKGERLTGHYSFYAVFQEEQSYHVFCGDGEIGTLDTCPAVGEAFVLGGCTWKAKDVDETHKKIYVVPLKNNRIPTWDGMAGQIHTRVAQRMRQILREDIRYPYLRPGAARVLEEARRIARASGMLQSPFVKSGEHSFFLCPWVGTREVRTIKYLLGGGFKEPLEIRCVSGGGLYLQVVSGLSAGEFLRRLQTLPVTGAPEDVLPPGQAPRVDKYDPMVPGQLLRLAFLQNEMDIPAAQQTLRTLRTTGEL